MSIDSSSLAAAAQTDSPVGELIDIHCHLLPGLDDGARSWEDAVAMAQMAQADGITTIIATPRQLGQYEHVRSELIRRRAGQLQGLLQELGVPVAVKPGADVRIENQLIGRLQRGEIVTLADRHRHVLLEMPHHMYCPIDSLLQQLHDEGVTGILSHPERNQGLLKEPQLVQSLVDQGCLMQLTAGSLLGRFGPASKEMAEWMLRQHLAHFVATDAHGVMTRRPLLQRAFQRVVELAGPEMAELLCRRHPAAVLSGSPVTALPRPSRRSVLARWIPWRRAA